MSHKLQEDPVVSRAKRVERYCRELLAKDPVTVIAELAAAAGPLEGVTFVRRIRERREYEEAPTEAIPLLLLAE